MRHLQSAEAVQTSQDHMSGYDKISNNSRGPGSFSQFTSLMSWFMHYAVAKLPTQYVRGAPSWLERLRLAFGFAQPGISQCGDTG